MWVAYAFSEYAKMLSRVEGLVMEDEDSDSSKSQRSRGNRGISFLQKKPDWKNGRKLRILNKRKLLTPKGFNTYDWIVHMEIDKNRNNTTMLFWQ